MGGLFELRAKHEGQKWTLSFYCISHLHDTYLKLFLLNNLGSLTGAMTSTPALGTLINVAKTDQVGNAYAATYPIALICVVLSAQFMVLLMK